MSYTLRERNGLAVPFAVWGLATVLCTIAGPFGTHAVLDVVPRFFYWAGIVALSVLGAAFCIRMGGMLPRRRRAVLWAGYVITLSGATHLVNSALFDTWQGAGQFLYLLGIVGVTVIVVHGAITLAKSVFAPADDAVPVDMQAVFLRRIPLEKRAPLIRMEAQDHYLNVVTHAGSALVLMRMQDAVDALAGVEGLQVHRSHWVAQAAVAAHRRDKGRDFLILSNGDEIPVSRSYRPFVQEAGLI